MKTVEETLESKGRNVVMGSEDDTILEASALLLENRIGVLVVTDSQGNASGIISERDIVRGLVEVGDKSLKIPVALPLTRQVITCSPKYSVESAMQLMGTHKIRYLPVVADNKLVGVISIVDLVRALLHRAEKEVENTIENGFKNHLVAIVSAYGIDPVAAYKLSAHAINC